MYLHLLHQQPQQPKRVRNDDRMFAPLDQPLQSVAVWSGQALSSGPDAMLSVLLYCKPGEDWNVSTPKPMPAFFVAVALILTRPNVL